MWLRRKFPGLTPAIFGARPGLIDTLGPLAQVAKIVADQQEFREVAADVKIAFHEFDNSAAKRQHHRSMVHQLAETSDRVYVFDTEIHQDHWTLMQQDLAGNVCWIGPGHAQGRWLPWPSYCKDVQDLYRSLPQVLDRLRPWEIKPKKFDALLGRRKSHREFIVSMIESHAMRSEVILSYDGVAARDWIWEPEVQKIPGTDPKISSDPVTYHGHRVLQALIMPIEVYNQTAYSIVAETNGVRDAVMITEKTAKCLAARRVFVLFAGRGHLAWLRRIGFRTFDHVLDESYDACENDLERWQKAWQQVLWLRDQDQQWVLDQCRDTLEHNFRLLFDTDWNQWLGTNLSLDLCDLIAQNVRFHGIAETIQTPLKPACPPI